MKEFTEITPGRITTDQIVSQDGLSVFDLKGNKMQLKKEGTNSSLTWNDGELEITGRLTQLRGGKDLYEVGVYLGNYDEHATYYIGDSVTWNMAGEICTYHCIKENANGEAPPSDSEFWKIVARGAKGDSGPSGTPGAPIVYRGDWHSSKEYYGNPNRLDVVKYEGRYYITKIISGVIPPNSPAPGISIAGEESKWGDFGANFDSVAVDLLFAEGANIGGWNIIGNKLASKESKIYLDGNTEQITLSDQIYLDSEGIRLFNNSHKIRAIIRKDDIPPNLKLGLSTKKYPTPLITKTVKNLALYGAHSGADNPKLITFQSGNLWDSGEILYEGCVCTIKKLKVSLRFDFKRITQTGTIALSGDKIIVTPVINGKEYRSQYYGRYVTVESESGSSSLKPQTISLEWLEDIIYEYPGKDKSAATIGFKIEMGAYNGSSTLFFDCAVTGSTGLYTVENGTDLMTVIAPNGFYSYTGNKNYILLSGDRVELSGGTGPEIYSGDYGLKVADDGIYVTNKYTAENDTDKWIVLFKQ